MIKYICILVLIQFVTGRSVDLEFGYQEIEDKSSQNDLDETKRIETLEKLCENLTDTIYVKQSDTHINCLESLFEDSREVKLVKRDTEKNEEIEGSGDSDDQKSPSSEPETTTPNAKPSEIVSTSEEKIVEPSSTTTYEPSSSTPDAVQKEYEASSTETPPLYKHGFDDIIKQFPSQQLHVNLTKGLNLPETSKNDLKVDTSASSSNNKPPIVAGEETVKTGASEEKQSGISPNNIFLIILGLLGVVGVLAFAFNYVRKKREDKEVDEVMKLEAEGRELKEMKPLMKSPLTQNGARSLEFIDAEPQNGNGIETRAEVNHNQEVE